MDPILAFYITEYARKLFGGYRITPRYCKPTKETSTELNGPNICMFNHECAQRNGEVVGACMDGFLFGTCCQLPEDVAGELEESDLNSATNPGNIIFQPTEQPVNNNIKNPVIGHITSNGVSHITNTLLGILPTAHDNAVVQVDVEDFSTPGVTHPTAPDTIIQNAYNDINPDDFKPIRDKDKTTTVRAESTTQFSVIKPSIKPSLFTTSSLYAKPIFKPKPQKPLEDKYVLVPTITHETKPNKTQEIESIVNIIQMLNGTSSTAYPSTTLNYLAESTTKIPAYIFSTSDPHFTKKPPSTSYIFSTTIPPKKPSTPVASITQFQTTQLTFTENPLKTSSKRPQIITSTTGRPAHSTYANSPDAFYTTKRPPSTSYVYSTTLSKRPIITQETTTPVPSYSPAASTPVSSVLSTIPNITPTIIFLSPATAQYSTTAPNINQRPNIPQRRPITQVTINNHITHNIYSTSERPVPTVLITPKPSSTVAPINAVTDYDSVYIEADTSPNELNNFPPVRHPNLNMSVPIVTEDDIPGFVEDDALNTKVELFVNKIIMGLQEPLNGLQDVVINNNSSALANAAANTTKKPVKKTSTTKKPGVKPTQNSKPSVKPTSYKATTKPTSAVVSKKPASASSKPTRKPTTVTTTSTEQQTLGPINQDYRKVCGARPLVKTGRIVGGKNAMFGEFPWQVLVRESTWLGLFTKNKCGGVLISNRYVMTAAHCQPGFLASLVAVFGEYDISNNMGSRRPLSRNVKRVIVHRSYDPATFANDLALLELEHPIHFDQHIIPICLPREEEDFTGRMATVTGWGRLKYGGVVPTMLQEVQVPIMENDVCQEMFRTAGHTKIILESFLCAGYANGQKDSCEGDSGGPLVLQRPDGRTTTMKGLIAVIAICLLGKQAEAWGGLFNRFSPEMLANMGYGGHGNSITRIGGGDEGILEEFEVNRGDEDPCYERPCTANEHCCPAQVCIDVDGETLPFVSAVGTCVFAYGRRIGELCRRDSDCESGLVCSEGDQGISARICRPPVQQDKQYSELCNMSSECDISRGLCCQLQRRHRQQPRKVCSYFKDPLVCIGPVAADQVKNAVQHTAGEKRLTRFTAFKRQMH
ncbi:transmembrane protease serine [Holotrichia oblita]|uniref:Transmembrane protease serine n=1 Tax=Holotrichia oblita TaxID=644536 RepID=A0ACB9TPD7_HOLOL|nr:transmembrane protease serine [Holotrichia oblita]